MNCGTIEREVRMRFLKREGEVKDFNNVPKYTSADVSDLHYPPKVSFFTRRVGYFKLLKATRPMT